MNGSIRRIIGGTFSPEMTLNDVEYLFEDFGPKPILQNDAHK